MHNIVDNIKIEQVVKPQIITNQILDSGAIDMQNIEVLNVAILVGDIVDILSSSAKIDLKIEHSDDAEEYLACGDADILNYQNVSEGVFASIDDEVKEDARYLVEYRGSKRYVKVSAIPTGLTQGGNIAMLALTTKHSRTPIANS